MDALQQWYKLNQAINVRHYIGAMAHKCIEDSVKKASEAKEAPEAKKDPEVKKVPEAKKAK